MLPPRALRGPGAASISTPTKCELIPDRTLMPFDGESADLPLRYSPLATEAPSAVHWTLEAVLEQPLETPGKTAERPDTDQPLLLPQLVAMGILDEPDAGGK